MHLTFQKFYENIGTRQFTREIKSKSKFVLDKTLMISLITNQRDRDVFSKHHQTPQLKHA